MSPNLKNISWLVEEKAYREDPALSYSTISRYLREGFDKLDHIYDRVESPSLTFGSAVDALITGGQEEFDNNFITADFPVIEDSVIKVVKELFNVYSSVYNRLSSIPVSDIISATETLNYQKNWKPETRARVIKEKGEEYYRLLYLAQGKTILDSITAEEVKNTVRALKESNSTSWFFLSETPFDNINRYYQLKFKSEINGVPYRCMADLIIVDHKNKRIIPVDLKTSSHSEWDFYKSFIQWNYQIQARLYWRIINDNIRKHPEFDDYTLEDYRFIVVNKKTLVPLVWVFPDTQVKGNITYTTSNGSIVFPDPTEVGKELHYYLSLRPITPKDIKVTGQNNIVEWIKKM